MRINLFAGLSAFGRRLAELPLKLLGRHDLVATDYRVVYLNTPPLKAALNQWARSLALDARVAEELAYIYIAELHARLVEEATADRGRGRPLPRVAYKPMTPPGTIFEVGVERRVRYFGVNQVRMTIVRIVTEAPRHRTSASPE